MSPTVKKILLVSIIILAGLYGYFSYQINTGKYKHPLDPSNTAVLSEANKSNKYKEFFSQFVSLDLLTVDMSSFSNSKIKEFIDTKILSKDSLATNRGSSVTITPPSQQPVGDIIGDLNDVNDFNLTRVTTKTSQFINTTRPVVKPKPTTTPIPRTPTTKPTNPIAYNPGDKPVDNKLPTINKPVEQVVDKPIEEKPVIVENKIPGVTKLTEEDLKNLPVPAVEVSEKLAIDIPNTGLSYPVEVAGIIDDVEAKSVIGAIKNNCGVDLSPYIDIIKDTSLTFPSYKIRGSQVRYNGDRDNNTAYYAVARMAEDLLGAKMPYPDPNTITCTKIVKNWDTLRFYNVTWNDSYYKKMHYFNVSPKGGERSWFMWHHFTTKPVPNEYYITHFMGLAQKYPHLTEFPPEQIKNDTKIDLLHPDVPKIIYDIWVEKGKPSVFSLHEIDANFFPYSKYFTVPPNLNRYEQEAFARAVQVGQMTGNGFDRNPDGSIKLRCKTYPDGEQSCITQYYADNIRKWIPYYVIKEGGKGRIILTSFYLDAWKKMEQYFIDQGANNVRFIIDAYSARYYLDPSYTPPNLKNFDVLYNPMGAATWNRQEMENDIQNFRRWEATGARVFWRPNLWYNNRFDPYFNFALHNEFPYRTKPEAFQISGYTPSAIPGTQAINFYTMLRILQGRSPQEARDDFLSAFSEQDRPLVAQYVQIAENITAESFETGELRPFTEEKVRELKNILSNGVASSPYGPSDYVFDTVKKGLEIREKHNEYQSGKLSKEAFTSWFANETKTYPGLGRIDRFSSALAKTSVPED